jgi:hypothetical protein
MKKELTSASDSQILTSTNDLLYSYSHKKFVKYMAIPEVKVLIDVILECMNTEEFVDKHSILSMNKDSYVCQLNKLRHEWSTSS